MILKLIVEMICVLTCCFLLSKQLIFIFVNDWMKDRMLAVLHQRKYYYSYAYLHQILYYSPCSSSSTDGHLSKMEVLRSLIQELRWIHLLVSYRLPQLWRQLNSHFLPKSPPIRLRMLQPLVGFKNPRILIQPIR